MSKVTKQDQVNNANSAFMLINCLISRGFQSGSIGQVQVIQVVQMVQVVRVVRVVQVVRVVRVVRGVRGVRWSGVQGG